MAKAKKPGPAPTGITPARQLGRIDATTWQTWQAAAAASGQTFTAWARAALNAAAHQSDTTNTDKG